MAKPKKKRNPIFERSFGEIGLIRKTYGTDDPDTITGIKVMMQTLFETGKHKFLEDVRDGKTSLLNLYANFQNNTLAAVANKDAREPLQATVDAWLKIHPDISDKTRANYGVLLRGFYKDGKVRAATLVSDLSTTLRNYKKIAVNKDTRRTFNMVRNVLRAFTKSEYGMFSEMYKSIVEVTPLPEHADRKTQPLTVPMVVELESALKDVGAPPAVGRMVWTLCTTGMEPTVYMERQYEVRKNPARVEIHGTKMAKVDDRRDRAVPMVLTELQDPVVEIKALRRWVKKAAAKMKLPKAFKDVVKVYDFRATFANWGLGAGLDWRVQAYMGHMPASMTYQYAQGDTGPHLEPDAVKMREFIRKAKQVTVNPNAAKVLDL